MVQDVTMPVSVDPKKEVAFAAECADALMEVINRKPKPVIINGERYLEFEDWQTIARFYQCTVSVDWAKPLTVKFDDSEGKQKEEFIGYESRASVIDRQGIIRSSAEATCTITEARWKGRERYQIKSMAQTRACAKALRNVFAWVVVMKGFKPTPIEEFTEYEPIVEKPNEGGPLSGLPKHPVSNGGELMKRELIKKLASSGSLVKADDKPAET